MNAFINIFFISVFIFMALFFNIPNIDNENYILHKIIISILLFVYQFLLIIINNLKSQCQINIWNVFYQGLETAVIGFIAYSIYTDLQFMNLITKPLNPNIQYLYITAIIASLLFALNSLKALSGFMPYQCVHSSQSVQTNNTQTEES